MNKVMVKNLAVDDVFKGENDVNLVVRKVLDNKVLVSKVAAQPGHGMFSVDFYSHKFDDLKNRVELSK